jgi:hypothetical protein
LLADVRRRAQQELRHARHRACLHHLDHTPQMCERRDNGRRSINKTVRTIFVLIGAAKGEGVR